MDQKNCKPYTTFTSGVEELKYSAIDTKLSPNLLLNQEDGDEQKTLHLPNVLCQQISAAPNNYACSQVNLQTLKSACYVNKLVLL